MVEVLGSSLRGDATVSRTGYCAYGVQQFGMRRSYLFLVSATLKLSWMVNPPRYDAMRVLGSGVCRIFSSNKMVPTDPAWLRSCLSLHGSCPCMVACCMDGRCRPSWTVSHGRRHARIIWTLPSCMNCPVLHGRGCYLDRSTAS